MQDFRIAGFILCNLFIMKKNLLLLLAGLVLSTGLLQAQGKSHLHISLGGAPAEFTSFQENQSGGIIDLYTMYEPQYVMNTEVPVFTLDYAVDMGRWFRLGLEMNYAELRGSVSYMLGNRPRMDFEKYILTALPELRLRIPSPRHFRLYCKAAAGVMVTMGKHQDPPVRFAYDLVPIGAEWGGQKIYGLGELCWGNVIRGGRIGLGFRF